jgi:hypothetical protein
MNAQADQVRILLPPPYYSRFKYRFDGKEKSLSLGTYPEISLADARQRRDEARKQVAHGIDPAGVRKAMKQAGTAETETFEVIAREWYLKFSPAWAPSHAETNMARLKRQATTPAHP